MELPCGLSLATSPLIALISGHHHQWHTDCLRCSECEESLSTERSCYLKNLRRAGSHVYHLACFACDLCQRQMSTGEQFTIDNATEDMKLLCKLHFGITTTSEGNKCALVFDQIKFKVEISNDSYTVLEPDFFIKLLSMVKLSMNNHKIHLFREIKFSFSVLFLSLVSRTLNIDFLLMFKIVNQAILNI
uniref:LIM zinc-binding domain-containing protein n=1 Tax=Tetranychus urticae TaxID=32264 RepID=T1KKP5_TETUR